MAKKQNFTLKQLIAFCMLFGILIVVIPKVYYWVFFHKLEVYPDELLIRYFEKEQINFQKASLLFFDKRKNDFVDDKGDEQYFKTQKELSLKCSYVRSVENGLLFFFSGARASNYEIAWSKGIAYFQKPPDSSYIVSSLERQSIWYKYKLDYQNHSYNSWSRYPTNILYRHIRGNWYLFLYTTPPDGP